MLSSTKMNRKRLIIVVCVAVFIALLAGLKVVLDRPKVLFPAKEDLTFYLHNYSIHERYKRENPTDGQRAPLSVIIISDDETLQKLRDFTKNIVPVSEWTEGPILGGTMIHIYAYSGPAEVSSLALFFNPRDGGNLEYLLRYPGEDKTMLGKADPELTEEFMEVFNQDDNSELYNLFDFKKK